jgi:hypothetical protein
MERHEDLLHERTDIRVIRPASPKEIAKELEKVDPSIGHTPKEFGLHRH